MLTRITSLIAMLPFFVAVAITQGQEKPEAYPGQSVHAMPPDDWFCSHDAKEKAHKCQCKRMAKATPDDPCCQSDEVRESAPEQESCAVYCHKDHCHCEVLCSTSHSSPTH